MLNHLIEAAVDASIEKTFKSKPEIANMIKSHERKTLLIQNLCREINAAQLQMGAKLRQKDIKYIVDSFVAMFANAALVEREKRFNIVRDEDIDNILEFKNES